MKPKMTSLLTSIVFSAVLTACGGGGGGSTANTGAGSGNTTSTQVVLTQLVVAPTDVIANTAKSTSAVAYLHEKFDRIFRKAYDTILPSAYAATGCGRLCSPNYPPVTTNANQLFSMRLANGSLVSLNPGYETADKTTNVACDFTNAGVQVNNLWILDSAQTSAIASLTTPSAVDSNCKLTYSTADYIIYPDKTVAKLSQNIISDISDIIPSGDQAFNTSPNAIIISKSTNVIKELAIGNTGAVTLTDLTTTTAPIQTYVGGMSYNGTYLVGVAKNFQGWVVYQKGSTAFRVVPDNTNTGYYSTFVSNQGQFIVGAGSNKNIINPVNSVLTPYAQNQPNGMYGANGRYGDWILSDRCLAFNVTTADWISLYSYPNNVTSADTTNPAFNLLFTFNGSINYSYARMAKNYGYCVAGAGGLLSSFVKYDFDTQTGKGFDLAAAGYAPSNYQIFSNAAYATVTNTANSDVLYIEMNFDTGALTYRGLISNGTRNVVELVKPHGI